MKSKRTNHRAEFIKGLSEVPIGGSEEETKVKVKQQFKKPLDADSRWKGMSQEDIDELDRIDKL